MSCDPEIVWRRFQVAREDATFKLRMDHGQDYVARGLWRYGDEGRRETFSVDGVDIVAVQLVWDRGQWHIETEWPTSTKAAVAAPGEAVVGKI